jgi:hypothetical protein
VTEHVDAQRPRGPARHRHGRVPGGEGAGRRVQEPRAVLGQSCLLTTAVEQQNAQLPLQSRDPLRQRLLRHAQLGRGLPEMPAVRRCDERSHLRQVQIHTAKLRSQPPVVNFADRLLDRAPAPEWTVLHEGMGPMKALVPRNGTIGFADVDEPRLGAHEALVRVEAFSVNRGETFQLDAPDLGILVRLLAGGRLHPEIGRTTDWADTATVLTDLRNRRIRGKAVLTVGDLL